MTARDPTTSTIPSKSSWCSRRVCPSPTAVVAGDQQAFAIPGAAQVCLRGWDTEPPSDLQAQRLVCNRVRQTQAHRARGVAAEPLEQAVVVAGAHPQLAGQQLAWWTLRQQPAEERLHLCGAEVAVQGQ
ncbi:MAG TPA: hypothetical protein VG147_05805 [Solirubrobacteraceae bacterium]|jgi:hypothetical protein|nr:hypothetical protein [Solirubrobacteraceae bacterium]